MTNAESTHQKPGPKTPESKAKTRHNAYKHGLTAKTLILSPEDRERYNAFAAGFMAELAPVGDTETFLATAAISQAWRLRTVPTICENIMALAHFDISQDRVYSDDPNLQDALVTAAATAASSSDLVRISLYEQRLHKSYERFLGQLKQLQAEREAKRQSELEAARNLYQFSKMNNLPWQPSDEGFVFSAEEIERYTSRFHREILGKEAASEFRRQFFHSPQPQRMRKAA